jgi:hypothetical protein
MHALIIPSFEAFEPSVASSNIAMPELAVSPVAGKTAAAPLV